MPTPRKGEKRKDFVSRCIPIVLKDGTASDKTQAAAMCYSMWSQHRKQRKTEAARPKRLSGLILSGLDASFAPADRTGLPDKRGKAECHYFWKEMLRPGVRFTDKNGRTQEITPQRIQTLATCYSRAAANGFEAGLPLGSHDVENVPNLGWIKRVEVRPDGALYGLHQFVGSEAAVNQIVASNKSSIGTITNYEDEHGNVYAELPVHNAILPHPRISGLKDFTPALAASRGQKAIAWDELQLAAPTDTHRSDPMPMTAEQKKRSLKITGAAQDTAEADLFDLVLSRCEEGLQLSQKIEGLNLELSQARPQKPSARELSFAAKAVLQARKSAIEGGAITAAVADQAEKMFLSAKTVDLNKMELSRKVEDNDYLVADGMSNLLNFYEAVAGNKPVTNGEESGRQTMDLARKVPGSPEQPDADADCNPLLDEAEKMAGKKSDKGAKKK